METRQFSAAQLLANCDRENCYNSAEKEVVKFMKDENGLDISSKVDVLLRLLRELYDEFSTNKAIISILFGALAQVSTVIQDIAASCRELMSSAVMPDSAHLTHLLQLQQMGVSTLGDLIGHLLTPDNVTIVAAMTMAEVASTICDMLSMSHVIFIVCQDAEKVTTPPVVAGVLLKSTFNFIKVISGLLDIIDLSQLDDNVCGVSKVVDHVYLVGKVTLHCEAAITVTTWRTMLKTLCCSKPHLPPDWSIHPIIRELCEAVRIKLDMCLRLAVQLQAVTGGNTTGQEGTLEFSRSVKMCRFMLNFILKLCKEFDMMLGCCVTDIYSLLLIILCSVPPSLTGVDLDTKGVLLQEINVSIMSMVHPLITKLCSCGQFIHTVTSGEGLGADQHLAWLICLLLTTEAFSNMTEELQELCMSCKQDDRSSCLLLDAVFYATQHCHVELCHPVCLPMLTSNGQLPIRMMSLCDYITSRLAAMILTLPVKLFHQVELLLLKYLFSDDLYSSLLAADVWLLVLRLEPAELRLHHITVLTGLLMTLPLSCSFITANLSSLINSMLGCLPLELQVQFIEDHSPSEASNLKLWAIIDLNNIVVDLRAQMCSVLGKACLVVIGDGLKESQVDVMNMHWAVCSLTKWLTGTPGRYPSLIRVILDLWSFAGKLDPKPPDNHMVCLLVCDVLHLISVAMAMLPIQEVVQVLIQLNTMVTCSGQANSVLISSTRILAQCGTLNVPDHLKVKFIQSIVSMFHHLLSHAHWLVHHHAAEAFRSFAEVTSYVEDLEKCIPTDLCQIIEDFLNKVPFRSSSDGALLTRDATCSRLRTRLCAIKELKQLMSAQRDEEKCLQQMESSVQCCTRGVSLLKQGLQELQKSQQATPLPNDVISQLTLFHKDLYSFLSMHNINTEPT